MKLADHKLVLHQIEHKQNGICKAQYVTDSLVGELFKSFTGTNANFKPILISQIGISQLSNRWARGWGWAGGLANVIYFNHWHFYMLH